MSSHLLAPSILSADFNQLGNDIRMINSSDADWFHVDVMDGVFVPNISFGFPILKHVKQISQKPLDVHLMIVNPDRYLEDFAAAGADIITVHQEACTHLHRTLQKIRSLGKKAGVAINPATPVAVLEDVLHEADLFLVMSVNPGFGGQKFIPRTLDKIRQLRIELDNTGSKALIEVDGGVDASNFRDVADAGADVLVAGSAVFNQPDRPAAIRLLKGF
ncbi:MAG: ribulose-phosphate 3-epimerase [Bacteroidia bacterium]